MLKYKTLQAKLFFAFCAFYKDILTGNDSLRNFLKQSILSDLVKSLKIFVLVGLVAIDIPYRSALINCH